MRAKDQGTLDAILKFVNKYYQKNREAPSITDGAEGVGVARSTAYRYPQELSERGVLDYNRVSEQDILLPIDLRQASILLPPVWDTAFRAAAGEGLIAAPGCC